MKKIILISIVWLSGCIGTDVLDDAVEEKIVIENPIMSLKVGDSHQFEARYLNRAGMEEMADIVWSSSNPEKISLDASGKATALEAGNATISAQFKGASTSFLLEAGDETIDAAEERTATLQTVSSYPLSGTVRLKKEEGRLILSFDDNFKTTSALPGLYVYLSNNTNTTNGALEVAKVAKFEGAQSYTITDTEELFDYNIVLFYCKPFVVPVGHGTLQP